MNVTGLRATVYCALFTALIIVGGFISVPLPVSPVPIVLADFFVMLAGLMLGPKLGLISVALYEVLGLIGLPVFAGGKAGIAVLMGPTGGFLIGYLLMVFVIGGVMQLFKAYKPGKVPRVSTMAIALIAGNVVLYIAGVSGMMLLLGLSLEAALLAGVVPFLPGVVVKVVAAGALCRFLLPRVSASQQ